MNALLEDFDFPLHLVEAHGTCTKHGAFTQSLPAGFPPHCSICQREEREERQRCERAMRVERLRGKACIPARFTGKTLSDWTPTTAEQQTVLAKANAFVENFKAGNGASLLMVGTPGTGKTLLACAIANELIQREYTTVFGTALQVIRGIKSTYARAAQITECDAVDALTRPAVLVLDEVGAQHGTTHELELLFDVFNTRYAELHSTILCSNMNLRELESLLGERILDRLRECAQMLVFDWPSHRRRAA